MVDFSRPTSDVLSHQVHGFWIQISGEITLQKVGVFEQQHERRAHARIRVGDDNGAVDALAERPYLVVSFLSLVGKSGRVVHFTGVDVDHLVVFFDPGFCRRAPVPAVDGGEVAYAEITHHTIIRAHQSEGGI